MPIPCQLRLFHFPLAAGSDPNQADQEGTTIQYLKPDTSSYFTSSAYEKEMTRELAKYKGRETIQITTENYMEVMELIYLYPNDFVGKKGHLYRFCLQWPTNQGLSVHLPFRYYPLYRRFRCLRTGDDGEVTKLSRTIHGWKSMVPSLWIIIKILKQSLPILNLTEVKEVGQPDNPYVYRVF